jgi:hypothetical protein
MKASRRISLPLKDLRADGVQIRAAMDPEHIGRLSEAYASAKTQEDMPPPPIAFWDGQDYWLADGFHRAAGAEDAGTKSLLVDVYDGTLRDAILWAVGPGNPNNDKTRALPISNADKRRKATLLLQDEEWREWSDTKIAAVCCVSHTFVWGIRKDLYPPTCNVAGSRKSLPAKSRRRKYTRKGKAQTIGLPPKDDLADLRDRLNRGDSHLAEAAEIYGELGDKRTVGAISRAQAAAAAFRKRKLSA